MLIYRNNTAIISEAVSSSAAKTSISVSGSVTFYKDGEYGVAYRKKGAKNWSYKAAESQSVSMSLTGLTADTTYEIKLYVLFDGEYQYGPTVEMKTAAS